jgi:hypothetical protein
MWWWRKMEKIRCVDRARNEEVLQRVEGKRKGLQTVKGREANWIGHLLFGGTAFENKLLKDR